MTIKLSKPGQYAISMALVGVAALVGIPLAEVAGYRAVAFLMMAAVCVMAVFFEIVPVFIATVLSALIWDYFFIPPRFNFHIGSPDDSVMLSMYLFIAVLNAAVTYRIRKVEKEALKKEDREHTIRLYNTVLNSLSHELRTPIATILGAADNLSQEDSNISQQNKQKLVNQISIASLRLNAQVENLLNISRLESGHIQPKRDWCDVGEILYSVINKMQGGTNTIRVELPEQLPLCRLDFGMTQQVLDNLLKNAVQYTPPGTAILVSAGVDRDLLTIVVADAGRGFPAEEIDRVFDKFYRVRNSATGGIGLGLSIVKGFVEALGGAIILENAAGGGARFTVRLPVETSALTTQQ